MQTIFYSLRRILFIVFLTNSLVFCATVDGLAATWYISPSGDDISGDGTIDNPWKTLFKATETVISNGDIIHVKAGTYIETQQCILSEGVSIEGEGISSIIQSTLTEDFKELLQLRSPEGANGNQHISNLKFDGQNLSTYWCIWIGGRSNVSIYNCSFSDFKDRGIIFSGRNDFLDGPPDLVYATGNKFYNNIVNNCAAYNISTGTYGRGCLNIGGQDGMLVYNNTITQNQRPEGYNGWPIKYMNHGFLKNCRIYNNTLTKIPYGGSSPGENGWDFCIELFNIEGLEISGNTIQGSIDLNYNRKGNAAYSVWIHHNIMSRDSLNSKFESGVIFEFITESAIVEYNVLNNISSGVQFNTRDSTVVSDCKIRKNLFSNLATGDTTGSAGGILMISEGTNTAIITNLDIDNNTITATTALGRQPHTGIDFSSINLGSATNVRIRNNIVRGFSEAWLKGGDTTNMNIIEVISNNAFDNGNNDLPSWPGGDPANYNYSSNLIIDPLFDTATNFLLQSLSPVIDLGVDIGLPFLGSNPDLGYAEYTGGSLPVKLIELSVKNNNAKNLLQWITATESNSDYFSIERSGNGSNYKTIGRVNAVGNSSININYSFTDAQPLAGKNYYRLLMMDKDNRKEYSNIVSLFSKQDKALEIVTAQLLPGKRQAAITVSSSQIQKATFSLFDTNGRLFLTESLQLQKGINTFNRKLPVLSGGIYYITLATADQTVVKSMLTED